MNSSLKPRKKPNRPNVCRGDNPYKLLALGKSTSKRAASEINNCVERVQILDDLQTAIRFYIRENEYLRGEIEELRSVVPVLTGNRPLALGSGTKRCSTCRRVKYRTDFARNTARKDGLRSECKQCKSVSDKNRKLKKKGIEQLELPVSGRRQVRQSRSSRSSSGSTG